jgi:hypothetical protein
MHPTATLLGADQGDLKVVERSLTGPCHSERSEESLSAFCTDASLRSE